MTPLKIPVIRARSKRKYYIKIDPSDIPNNIYRKALVLGMKDLINRKASMITYESLHGNDAVKMRKQAIKIAKGNLDRIMKGMLP